MDRLERGLCPLEDTIADVVELKKAQAGTNLLLVGILVMNVSTYVLLVYRSVSGHW